MDQPAERGTTLAALADELVAAVGLSATVDVCVDLLGGADPTTYAAELGFLTRSGSAAGSVAAWDSSWVRSWGARGLLRIWLDHATPAVVRGLDDVHWRPVEMCLKVATRRELGEAGPGAAQLCRHELPRVRAQAVRALGVVGDTEHADVVQVLLEDDAEVVRRAAGLAWTRMGARLDLPS